MAATVPERSMRPGRYSCVLVKGWVVRIDAGKWAVGEGNEGQGEGRQWRLSPEAETPRFLGVGECLWSSRYAHMFLLSVPLSLLRARANTRFLNEGRGTTKRAATYFCCESSAFLLTGGLLFNFCRALFVVSAYFFFPTYGIIMRTCIYVTHRFKRVVLNASLSRVGSFRTGSPLSESG